MGCTKNGWLRGLFARRVYLFGYAVLGCAVLLNVSFARGDSPSPDLGYRAGLYDTSWPADMANLNRSNATKDSGFPVGTTADDVEMDTIEMPFPSFSYCRNENEVYVLGGAPFLLGQFVDKIDGQNGSAPKIDPAQISKKDAFEMLMGGNKPEPHLTKFNAATGEQKRVDLLKGSTVPYIGGALIHENGYVYVISQSYLYKIDGESMEVLDSTQLPLAPEPNAKMTIYNGIATSSTGELITKFWVLGAPASTFMLIDPDSLEVTFQLDYPGASPRLTVAKDKDGKEYLYHLNSRNTFRFLIGKGSLALDENWQARFDPYNTGKDENDEPTSPVIVGSRVFYTTNTDLTSPNPMKMFWQDIDQSYSIEDAPLSGVYLFDQAEGPGWNFFHLSIDDASGIIIGTDQGNGLIAAVRVNEAGELERLWERKMKVSARPAIASDRGMVYATDYVDGHNDLVVLDLVTGKELIRKTTAATRATIGTIILTRNNEVYFGSNEPGKATGLFHRFYIDG